MVEVGKKAPAFSLKDSEGKRVRLSDFKGQKVVLYFYPRDMTPGCTKEACGFRDDFKALRRRGIEVIGISLDDEKSHRKFIEKHGLPFALLCDTEAEVSKKYGVYQKKKLYGKEFWGIKRTTFLIDENGKVAHVFAKPDCDTHSRDVLASLKE